MKPADEPFDNLEARLMLLAAGELPAAEADPLRKRLAEDTSLSARYEALASQLAAVESSLGRVDEVEPVALAQRYRAEQEANRAVTTWVAGQADMGSRIPPPSPLESAVWRYARWPLAAAAAVVVGLILLPMVVDPENPSRETVGGPSGMASPGAVVAADRFGDEPVRGSVRPHQEFTSPLQEEVTPERGLLDDTEQRLAMLFASPAGQWSADDDESFDAMQLGASLNSELATLQALGDAWSDDGF